MRRIVAAVGIEEYDNVAIGGPIQRGDAGEARTAVAPSGLTHDARAPLYRDLRRAVPRAIVHDNDVIDQRRGQRGEHARQRLLFVQCRKDDVHSHPPYIRIMLRSPRAALGCGLALELLAFTAFAAVGDSGASVPLALAGLALAAAGFLLAITNLARSQLPTGLVLLFALVLRAPLFPVEPSLSDDVWRYLHDGRAQLAGVSPFESPPSDPSTIPFRGPEFDRINHPELVTIYPPFAQLTFAASAVLGSTLAGWKLILLAFEAALIVLLGHALRQRGRPPTLAAVYAWNPLAVAEVAAGAHVEPVAIATLLAALVLAGSGRPLFAGVALGLSVATKYFALPLAPFLDRARVGRTAVGCGAAVLLVSSPYLLAGPDVFGSLFVFTRSWSSNAGIFAVLAALTGGTAARILVGLGLLGLLAHAWVRGSTAHDTAFAFVFATLLLSPVVHPWYLLWLVALLPLTSAPAPVRAAALLWSLTVPSAYIAVSAYRATGEWSVPLGARLVQYLPVLLLLAVAALNHRTGARHTATRSAGRAE